MGRICILLCLLLFVLSNNGFGRQLVVDMSAREDQDNIATELQGKSREMIELDYVYAGPNSNGRSVYPLPSLPQPPPPPPPPPPESGY